MIHFIDHFLQVRVFDHFYLVLLRELLLVVIIYVLDFGALETFYIGTEPRGKQEIFIAYFAEN
jgi:hypothetical protein